MSRFKKLLFSRPAKLIGVNALVLLVLTYIAGLVVNKVKYRSFFVDLPSDDSIALGRLPKIKAGIKQAPAIDQHQKKCLVTHPYFGYSNICNVEHENLFTKYYSQSDLQGEDVLRVLVLGGSVASHISTRASLELSLNKRLEILKDQYPWLPRRSIVFNAALPGFKQPQQLFAMQYLFLDGYQFDYVVNINGFNEIALPYVENHSSGLRAILPRMHSFKEQKESEYLPYGYSNIFSAYVIAAADFAFHWHPLYHSLRSRLVKLPVIGLQSIRHDRAENIAKFKRYEDSPSKSKSEIIERSLEVWSRSSRLTNLLASSWGSRYFEYFQPNQYLDGQKILSPAELEIMSGGTQYSVPIRKHYARVDFGTLGLPRDSVWDGRSLFKSTPQTVYSDSCCHMNSDGMALMAEDVARRLLFDLTTQGSGRVGRN